MLVLTYELQIQTREYMISSKMKFLSAATVVASLIAVQALAATVQMQAPTTNQGDRSPGTVPATNPGQNNHFQQHGVLACGEISYPECEKLKSMLPL
jgi:hypothetical protein